MKARRRPGAAGDHALLIARIIESIEIADQLSVSDPCPLTVEVKGLLRRAYASVSDRAAALRLLGRLPRRPAVRPTSSELLRGIQAARARQPRRRWALARLFGGHR